MRDVRKVLPWLLLAGLWGPGCGPNELTGTAAVDVEGAATSKLRDVYVPVRRAGRSSGMEVAMAGVPKLGGPPQLLYLNRESTTLTGGDDDASRNRSSIVSGRTTIPRYRGSDAAWQQIVACMKDEYARFNVTVTDTRPPSGPYVMAMFGGDGSEVGFDRNVGGVAPMDDQGCTIIDSAVVFIFPENLGVGDSQTLCEVAAQETGHAFSLDHEMLASDPMTYLDYNGHKTFQDKTVACGESGARSCVCRRPNQNSVQVLGQKLGWAGGPPPPPPPPGMGPKVEVLGPSDGDTLPANSTIQIVASAKADAGIGKVELLWRYNGATFACPGQYCTQAGDRYTFSLNVGSGERRFQVRATDKAGLSATTPERVIQLQDKGGGDGLTFQIVQPRSGDTVKAGSTLQLVVDVRSPYGVENVQMTWSGPYGAVTDWLAQQSGDRWSLDVNVSGSAKAGARQITVSANDRAGNSASAPPIRLNLVE